MSNVYEGKHRHQEVAEFVVMAMSVYDRQYGMISNSWEALNTTEKAAAVQRVRDFEERKLGNPKDEREAMERRLFSMLLPGTKDAKGLEELKDLEALVKEAKAPLPDRGKVEIHGTETGRFSSDPNDKPPAPILPGTPGEGTTGVQKPTIIK